MLVPEVAAYPAHLHIDLLPDWQGRGHGRALMRTFLDALRARGVPAVHLSMVTGNTAARAFYDRLGFHEIDVPDADPGVTYLGARHRLLTAKTARTGRTERTGRTVRKARGPRTVAMYRVSRE